MFVLTVDDLDEAAIFFRDHNIKIPYGSGAWINDAETSMFFNEMRFYLFIPQAVDRARRGGSECLVCDRKKRNKYAETTSHNKHPYTNRCSVGIV